LKYRTPEEWKQEKTAVLLTINAEFLWVFDPFHELFADYWKPRMKNQPKGLYDHQRFEMQLPPPTPPGAFFDYLPVANDRVLFFLVWQNNLQFWEGRLDLKSDALARKNPVSRKALGTIPVAWTEPFVVYGVPPHFLLITESGRLFAWRNAGQPNQKLESLWNEPLRIRVLISDADSGKLWAFTATDPGEKKLTPLYFLLHLDKATKDAQADSYKLVQIQNEHLPAKVRPLLSYAKVLQDGRKIEILKK
jgi:hypothetical protein